MPTSKNKTHPKTKSARKVAAPKKIARPAVRVGAAPDSWGIWFADDPKQTPWNRFLDEVARAGYEYTELGPYGYLPTDLKVLRRELKARGLKIVASAIQRNLDDPAQWDALEKEVNGAGESLAALGAKYLVLIQDTYSDLQTGKLLRPNVASDDEWKRLIETTHRVADIAISRFGLALTFHPHAETHIEYEWQIEKFLADTDPARVGLCFDTGHHAYRGGDPIAFMLKHHKRIPYLHLKSIDANIRAKVQAEKIPFALAVGMNMFVEPAQGAVDFKAFRDVLRQVKYKGYVMVEQDMYPAPFDKPFPIAKRTRAYLKKIHIG